ncbi:hypothetical protein [Acaryochloris marina]|uniref:hypothetical protein n=1 Tax=Acaryochloris marina TaxID=155978 RepID=UPI001BAF2AEF|nr:hypothetical protein [Acaryochloris marina]QUY42196.1 hypothetical protein I1H34_23805 [Acaryochloris marina S15]
MSSVISIKKFALWFGLYALGSFIAHNLLAFTIPVAIAFLMLVLPEYGVGLLYLIFHAIKHPHGHLMPICVLNRNSHMRKIGRSCLK